MGERVNIFVNSCLLPGFGKDDDHGFIFKDIPKAIDWLMENKDYIDTRNKNSKEYIEKRDYYMSLFKSKMKEANLGDFSNEDVLPKKSVVFKADKSPFEVTITDENAEKYLSELETNLIEKIKNNITKIKPLSLGDIDVKTQFGVAHNIPYKLLYPDSYHSKPDYWLDTVVPPMEEYKDTFSNKIAKVTFDENMHLTKIGYEEPDKELFVKPAIYSKIGLTKQEKLLLNRYMEEDKPLNINGLNFHYIGGIPYKESSITSHREIFLYDSFLTEKDKNGYDVYKSVPFAKKDTDMYKEIKNCKTQTDNQTIIASFKFSVANGNKFDVFRSPVQTAIDRWALENNLIIQKQQTQGRNDQLQRELTYEETHKNKDDWQLGE